MARVGPALPVELDFDAVVAVGVDRLSQADDDGGLRAVAGGVRMDAWVGQAVCQRFNAKGPMHRATAGR